MAKDLLVVLDENKRLTEKLQQAHVKNSEQQEQLAEAKAAIRDAQGEVAAARAVEEKSRRLAEAAGEKLTELKKRHGEVTEELDKTATAKNEAQRLLKETREELAAAMKGLRHLRDYVEAGQSQAERARSRSNIEGLSYMRVPGR